MRTIHRTPMKKRQREIGGAVRQGIEVDIKREQQGKEGKPVGKPVAVGQGSG